MNYLMKIEFDSIVLLQAVCFAVMYCFLNYPSTNLLTDVCMYLGALLSLLILLKQGYFIQKRLPAEIWLIIGLFIWVTIHLIFFKGDYQLQLKEYFSIWKRSIIIVIFGFGFGCGLSRLIQNKKVFTIFYFGLLSPSIIYMIKFLLNIYANSWGILIPEYLVLYASRTSHFYMYKIDYTVACLPAFSVNLFLLAYGFREGILTFSKYTILILSSLLVLSVFYLENIKNGFAYASILIFTFFIINAYSLVQNITLSVLRGWQLKKIFIITFLVFTTVLLFTTLLTKHIEKNDTWGSLLADAKIAVQVEKYEHWKYFGEKGYPQNELGNTVSNSNYERVAWGIIGLQLIKEYPLGYGLVERSFGHLARSKWPDSNLDQSHSGILDLTMGIGVPGVCILLAIYFLTIFKLIGRVCDRKPSLDNKLWMSSLIWILFSMALIWLSSEISQKYYLIATLFWIAFGAGLLGDNDRSDSLILK